MRADAYRTFTRAEWALLRANTPLTLTETDIASLRGINDQVSLEEIADVYLPLSRLLNLHVRAARNLNGVTDTFLGHPIGGRTYVIAIAGSVAVGKSTFARVLRALMARWPDHPEVDLVTTDGFLYPLRELQEKQLMSRKGFPESYDTRRMVQFLADVKAGHAEARAPVYSHQAYDIVADQWQTVRRPDVLIFEDPVGFLRLLDLPRRSNVGHRSLVPGALPAVAAHRVPAADLVLSPLQGPRPRGSACRRSTHLDRDQRIEPAREHPADPRTRAHCAFQGRRPFDRAGLAAADIERGPRSGPPIF